MIKRAEKIPVKYRLIPLPNGLRQYFQGLFIISFYIKFLNPMNFLFLYFTVPVNPIRKFSIFLLDTLK